MSIIKDQDFLQEIPDVIREKLDSTHLVFPGFVNAHDHLDFNLFPLLSDQVFNDYIEWGEYLHKNHESEIQQVLRIPLQLRLQFGILKNLINGFGGVVHHGAHHLLIRSLTNFPVWLNYQYAHAIATDKFWRFKLNFPHRYPLMIHLGEGKSLRAIEETDQLIKWNLIKRKVVAIHAPAMNDQQAKRFEAVVWCPDSNLNLYGTTLRPARVMENTRLLFGTDSTLSASADAWSHYRRSLEEKLITEETLFKVLTQNSWSFFSDKPTHNIWIVAKKKGNDFLNSFFQITPADILLVWIKGESWLCDESFELKPKNGAPILINNRVKWIHAELAHVISSLEKLKVGLPLELKSA